MSITFKCPTCQKSLKTKDEFAGKKVRCPGCQGVVPIPLLGGAPPVIAPPRPSPLPVAAKFALPPEMDDIDRLLQFDPPPAKPATFPPLVSLPVPASPAAVNIGGKLVAPRKDRLSIFSLVFLLMMLPLVLITLRGDDKMEVRIQKAAQRIQQEYEKKMAAAAQNAPSGAPTGSPPVITLPEETGDDGESDIESLAGLRSLIKAMPDHRLDDKALLPVDSMQHWVYALISGVVFFATLWGMSTGSATSPWRLISSGILTGTVGIVMLLIIQVIAIHLAGYWRIGFSVVTLVFYVLKFIGFSYQCALDPSSPFVVSFFGFTFGVGLCEELCKAIPVAAYLGRSGKLLTWKGALLVGLASGVGFGISEGISYSSSHYNGIADGLTYLVRFCSCVSLHAIWCGSVALMMYPDKSSLLGFDEFTDYFNFVLRYMLISMILHGLYDTLLTHELNALAVLVAIASFGWLFFMIRVRRGDVKFAS